jgi:hypothetical protein
MIDLMDVFDIAYSVYYCFWFCKDDEVKVLVMEHYIKARLKNYIHKLFNEDHMSIIWTQTTLMLETGIQITPTTKEFKNLR